MRVRLALFAVALLAASSSPARGESDVVIAIRYLQAQGESHAHLFLYREDGTLVRQLTKDDSGQDLDPMFAPDGETVVFTREIGANKFEFWSLQPSGAGLTRLEAAPEWYYNTNSPYFAWPDLGSGDDENATPFGQRGPRFRAPDGSVELILREIKQDEDDSINGPGHGKHYLLHDLKSGKQIEFWKLPGFEGAVEQLQLKGRRDDRFLIEPPLRLAFFGVHLNSTDGDTSYALDLTNRRFVRLSPNWAAPIPLPGEPAFLAMAYVRYVPIPGSTKAANCSYLERWDASLTKVRYAREGTAAVCYGASIYRPGKTPATITIRKSSD